VGSNLLRTCGRNESELNLVFGGRHSELNEQAKPFERGGRGEREERQKDLKLSALFAPSAFNGLEDWAAAVCTSIFPVLPSKVSHAEVAHTCPP
jgi:hypothetical protein